MGDSLDAPGKENETRKNHEANSLAIFYDVLSPPLTKAGIISLQATCKTEYV